MNKFFKRLALLLAVLMIVSMMPVQLFADNSVTGEGQSNGTGEVKSAIVVRYFMGESSVDMEYDASNIASAVSGIVGNMAKYADEGVTAITVTLNEDVTATSTLTFANDVTFDLNGHTLTVATNGDGIVVNNAALTLTNSGTTGKYVFDCSVRGSDGIFVNNTEDRKISTLNINSDVEIHANSNVNSAVHALAKKGEAIVNINAGKIVATGSGKQFHAIHADQNSTVNIYDGEFDLNVDFTSYSENNDVVGIAIYGADNKQENITVNINGGTFKVGGKNAFAQVVQVGMSNGYSKNCTVNISGGEVILNPTENGTGYVYATYKTSYATAEISGGKVSGNVTALVNPYMTVAEIENDGLTISGGTFTTTSGTTLNVEKYLAEDATYDAETGTVKTNYVATVNGVGYATLAEAIAAATPDANGVITYEISGKAEISGADQWISFVKNAEGVKAVKFVGTADAEISITSSGSILGVQGVDVDVSFENLTLSHPNGIWVEDLANATNYFACMVRRDGHTVTYTNCTFPNGACNNQYGKTVFNDCKFTSTTGWSLWNTSTGTSELNNCSFTGKRGIKLYAEGPTSAAGSVTVKDTTFVLNDSEKAAIEITKPGSVALDNISVSGTTAGTIKKNLTDGYKSVEKVTVTATGTGISGTFNGTTESGVAKEEFNISAGTFTSEVSSDYLADGFKLKDNGNGTYGVKAASVAKIGTVEYASLDDAIKAAKDRDVIVVSAGEYKLNGSLTYTGKAFTIKAADGANVSFDMSNAVALHGAKITFKGVTFDYKTNGNYIGIQHADTLVYNNCTINGQVFLYATNETFNDCIFIQTSADAYNVWTYGAKNVEFNRCVFNCVGRCVLVYNEGAVSKTELEVVDTDFIASEPASGKAAIEIDTRFMADGATITVDGKTKADRFDKGSNSGNSLWNDKANEKASDNENVTVVVADETVYEPAIIDLDTFIKKLVASGYDFDGKLKNGGKLTVKWSPVSGCFDEHHALGADCPKTAATGNTPKRVNSGLTQFQLFEGSNVAVTIKNVKFVYEPADVKICINSGWKGSYTAEQALAGQLYFMTTGDVTVDNCDFEKVVFTTFNTTGTSTVKNCTFKDVYNSYAIKDIRGGNVSVTGTIIENCGGGIMVSSTGTVSNVTITGNKFNNVDTAETAASDKVGTRAILQIASLGKYENTAFDFSRNSATSCGPVIRQLNKSVAPVGSSLKYLTEGTNSASGLYTSDSNVTYVAEVTFVDGTVEKYETLIEALKAGLSGKEGTITKLLANGTVSGVTIARIIDLNGCTLTTDDLNLDSSNGKDLIVTDSSNDKNGKLVITGSAKMSIAHKIILKSGTIETSRTINQDYGVNNTIEINGGTLILKNGATLTNSMPRTVTINGGTIIPDAGKSIFKAGSSTLNVIIKGGDFTRVGKLTESTSNIKFSISGGTFSADVPEEYCAKDYYPAHFNDRTKGVKKETVSTEKELRRALYEAALDGSLTRIKLTGNIKLEMLYAAENFGTEKLDDNAIGDTFNRYKLGVHPTAEDPDHWNPLVINQTQEERVVYGAYYHVSATDERIARLVIKAGQNVVIDLNGYTIEKNARATHGDWSNTCTDIIGNYGTLEIKDSAGTNGTIKGNGYISCNGAVLHNYEGGVMTVGAVNVDGNAAGMTAGKGQYVIANDGGKTIINGTNVYDTATSASLVVNTAGKITITGNATLNHPETKTINVKGGDVIIESATIISNKYSIYAAEGKTTITGKVTVNGTGKMAVEGGEIVKTADAKVGGVPEGYEWFANVDGTQSLSKAYAKIGETYYKSLADALAAANADDTIVLLDNVTLNSPLAISKDVTIDLNKKTIDTKAGVRAITITSGNVTIKNGTVKMGTVVNGSTRESGYTIYVNTAEGENVTLNLENVTVIGGENQKSGVTDATVDALKANGMYSNQTTAGTALYIYGKKSVGNTIVNIKNSTIIGGYGSATNGTQTKYISGGANMADGGDAITAIGDNVVLTIIDGSTIKGGDSDLLNAGIGVELQSGTLTVDGSTVTGGSCLKCDKSYGIAGDAVYVGSVAKSATIKNSTIIGGNGGYSYDGSGIEIRKNDNAPAIVTVEDSTIKSGNGENANKDYAGAIYLGGWDDSADLTFKGDNTLAGSDGKYGVIRGGVTDGIKLDGNLTIDKGTLKNTLLTEVSAGSTIKSGENAKVDADTVASTDENAAMNTTPAADGTYSFVAAVAQVIDRAGNKLSYASIDAAIAAADAGETVKLLADVTADVVINKNITLDLGGKTLTNKGAGKATVSVTGGTTATVKNGNVVGGTSYYAIQNNGTATLTDITVTGNNAASLIDNWGTMTIKSGTYTGGLDTVKNESNAVLDISGGTFTLTKGTSKGFTGVVFNYGTLTISGGEFIQSHKSAPYGQAQVIHTDKSGSATPSTIITGGTFKNLCTKSTAWTVRATNAAAGATKVSGGTFNKSVSQSYFTKGYECVKKADGTYGVQEATKGSKNYPYTLAELSVMTRDKYIAAQKALGGTMYVEIGNYSYDKDGVLGNGVRNDTPGQMPDHSKLNSYGENGYIGANNDGANGKKIIFVGGSITSGVEGYTSIDNIGTSLLLAVPAYTNVTFEGVTFNNVMSFDYQLYTSPWSQLGELKFSGCTFNGIIVGAIAAQTLTFDGCEFKNYTNKISANNSNPTWIRPAYGNWSKGDNDGQGSDFKSLTTINFTGNKVTSTRPVKFEYISQWDITSTVTATGNYFDITAQSNDTSIKNVGLYLGAHTDANEFHLVAADNTKSENTAALYTIPSGKTSLPVDSTVKNTAGESIELTDALKWKATDAEKDKIVLKTVIAVASIGERRFATLEEAVAAVAKNGEEVTIKLLSNITAGGIDVAAGQNIVFDFDGHTYTLDGSMVGSTGTKTNGFRFLKGSTVVLKNGTLANGNGSPAKAMINSYATLKLVDFSVDARTTAVAETGSAYGYAALYISNGVTTVTGNGNYTTSDDKFVILIANVGDYTDGASLVFDENYTGTVSGRVSTGNKQNATVEIKNGKFDLKSIDVENTNTTVTISGGKFKNIEIAGKYLDNKAFDTEADADGYYAVMAHPITGIGLSIGEDISLRVIVRNGYQDGKLFYSYIDANGNLVEEKATIGKDTKGNYVFRIYNINPQRAGTIYTLRYEDKAGNTVGALKEASILTYLEGLYNKKIENETATKEAARKVYIANFLEYCAAAATRAYPDDESRTQAIRDLMNKLGLEVTHFTLDEDHAGETYNDNAEKVFTGLGIEYGSIMRIYYAVSEEAYNAGYVYKQAGHVISNPIEIVEGKNGKEYRLYLNIPPYEYFSGQTITVEDSEGNTICVYSCPMGRILLRFSNTEKYEEKVTSVARAAFDYCAALKAYLRSK